jgi:hypothetical protein
VLAVARTIWFYQTQNLQLGAQVLAQVMATTTSSSICLTLLQIAHYMKMWSDSFGMDGVMRSLDGEGEAVQAAFRSLFQ